ncbi:MAG TPA: MogA/MoaB family molybdenum cofactor biosynthesis protein [Sedimentisphaerales bacterium]|nr:MogA/MoaB family molybdenum cofactor biosynthesis protein [Sedimentisphaerales bacterium]
MIRVAILTVSDSCAQGQREDISGQTIKDILPEDRFEICRKKIVADDHEKIVNELKHFSDKADIDIVFTTGGTGLGPRDVTPEATASVCERIIPGLGEIMRAEGLKKTKNAILSRGIAGICNRTIVINLPGSPKGVKESLEIILDVLPHAVDMMHGGGH